MIRNAVKSAIERGAVLSGITAMSRLRRRGEILILAYHNIVPTGERQVGDRSLHLPQHDFAQWLDLLCETHDFLSLPELIALTKARETGEECSAPHDEPGLRPRIVITFDDAYAGAVTAGVEELRARKLPATVFVAPWYVSGRSFWWDTVTPVGAAGLDQSERDRALKEDAGRSSRILERIRATAPERITPMPEYARCATEEQLRQALDYPELTLGAHSWSHPNLTELNSTELAYELRAPFDWLLEQFPKHTISAISYPYGIANDRVFQAAQQAGYQIGLMIEGGWATLPLAAPYAVPRLNVPSGVSTDGFVLRTSGLRTT